MTTYLLLTITGALLTAWAFRQFRREQRRARTLARLHRLTDWQGWPDEAGYYPGSKVDPRD